MAENKTPAASTAPGSVDKSGTIVQATEDNSPDLKGLGTVTHREDASGTRQQEPKPEDFPASAKVAPPSYQVSPASDTAVGRVHSKPDETEDALAAAEKAHTANVSKANKAAEQIADLRRDLEDKLDESESK